MISNELLKKKILSDAVHGRLVENEQKYIKEIYQKYESKSELFEIPSNWKWINLNNVCQIIFSAPSPKYSINENDNYCLGQKNNQSYGLDLTGMKYCTDEFMKYYKKEYYLQKGDVLLNSLGTGSVGRIGIFDLENDKYITDGHLLVFRHNNDLNEKFLFYVMKYFENIFEQMAIGSTHQAFLKINILKNFEIPFCSLEEQEKIVKKIEELFELIDKKEKNDKEKEKVKALLKEKILDSAIHGELIKNDLSLPAINIEEIKEDIPFDVPSNWKWSHIENCVQINPRNKINDEIFVGFVPMTNILGGYESKIVFESKKWKYVKKGYTHIKTDDVIVAKITPCFENRKSAYIKDLPSGYGAGTTEIHVLRNINNKMYMKYLLWFVKTNYFIKDGRNHFTGTAGQQRISKQWLSKFLIPVPPLEQQKKIVEKIEECFKLIEQL